jgi:hypothetical protein
MDLFRRPVFAGSGIEALDGNPIWRLREFIVNERCLFQVQKV